MKPSHLLEAGMAKVVTNLSGLDVDGLLALRAQIDKRLSEKRIELERELSRLAQTARANGDGRGGRGVRSHPLKGGKIPPKYRNPDDPSQTWAGRGAQPLWMAALIKQGKKPDDFLIHGARGTGKSGGRRGSRKAK
jgi:DNA-binding protein H-NS